MRATCRQGVSAPIDIASGLLNVIAGALGVVGIVAALAAIEPLLVPMVLLGYAPVWIASTRNSLALYTFDFGLTANDRARTYLEQVLTGRDTAKEVRAFALHEYLSQRWQALYEERMNDVRSLVRQQLRRSTVASTVMSLLLAGTFGILVALWLGGRIGLAGGATAAIALQQLGARLQIMSEQANSLYESGLFLEDYTSFLTLGEVTKSAISDGADEPIPRAPKRLELRDVGYTYPGASKPTLHNISLEFGGNEIVALVGENGSGKTTLAKLLCGLYPPTSGEILCDGIDVGTFGPQRLRQSIAVIFQEFARYQLSVWDNLAVGDPSRADDHAGMEASAHAAGAHSFLATLPKGYDTMLSPQFEGGADLSLGQWQRVAIARAFFRNSPFWS